MPTKINAYGQRNSSKVIVKGTQEANMLKQEPHTNQRELGPMKVIFEFPVYSVQDEAVKSEVKRIMTGALQEQLQKIS